MDSILQSAVEEICRAGTNGVSLQNLWSKLQPCVSAAGLSITCSAVKRAIWANIATFPGLSFQANGEILSNVGAYSLDECEKLQPEFKIIASQNLRNSSLGLYGELASALKEEDMRVLERLLVARTNGMAQSELTRESGKKPNEFFNTLRKLEARGLIVRQPAVVRTKKGTKYSSIVTTNMVYLSRYGNRLNAQQKLEITKQEKHPDEGQVEVQNVVDDDEFAEEPVKDDVGIKDHLTAMKAVCEKLDKTEGKTLAVSDIKKELGYVKKSGHRLWRSVCRSLKDANLVEEFCAKTNNKEKTCLRLLKKYSVQDFEPKSIGKENKGRMTEQLVELSIYRQIYDIIDAAGPTGLMRIEVLERLGIPRSRNDTWLDKIFSRFGIHQQKEKCKRSEAYRVWTSKTSNRENSSHVSSGPKAPLQENTECDPYLNVEFHANPAQEGKTLDAATSNNDFGVICDKEKGETHPQVCDGALVNGSDHSMSHSLRNSGKSDSVCELTDNIPESSKLNVSTVASDNSRLNMLLPLQSTGKMDVSYKRHAGLTLREASDQREQRILKMLQENKFLIKPELQRWLQSLETDKHSKMCRKTLERSLIRLQQAGHCKCICVRLPLTMDWRCNKTVVVILHPSIQILSNELVTQIRERLRSFECHIRHRGSSRLSDEQSVPGIQRNSDGLRPDTQVKGADVKLATGHSWTKVMRAKLLHIFLWNYLCSSPGQDDTPSFEDSILDVEKPKSSCIFFNLETAIMAMPMELFLQVSGSDKKFEELTETDKNQVCLSDLPPSQHDLLKDWQALKQISELVVILQDLKLILLVSDEHAKDIACVQQIALKHALEIKPYIEKHISRRFVLSSREAVDEYWNALENCYSAPKSKVTLRGLPQYAVPEDSHVTTSETSDAIPKEVHCSGRRTHSSNPRRSYCLYQKYKCDKRGIGVSRQVNESIIFSNAKELFKLILLSMSKAPQVLTSLVQILRQYSEHDLFAALSYLREKKILIGGAGTSTLKLSCRLLRAVRSSHFPMNTGQRAAKLASWLQENEADLVVEGIDVPSDLACGDVFHLFCLVSSGGLSITLSLPDEGVGQKRKSDINRMHDSNKFKKLRCTSLTQGEIVPRQEKGFPGIKLTLSCATISTTDALEMFKDKKSAISGINDRFGTMSNPEFGRNCLDTDEANCSPKISKSEHTIGSVLHATDSTWEAMAGYANQWLSNQDNHASFYPELFSSAYSAIQSSAERGLSLEEIAEEVNINGQGMLDVVVEVLESFGRVLKVNAHDSIRMVDSIYLSKYRVTYAAAVHQDTKKHQSRDTKGKSDDYDNHLPCGGSDKNENSTSSQLYERFLPGPSSAGELPDLHVGASDLCRPLLPWINGDGTVNEIVYKGLMRRLLGIIMLNPGILENEIIKQMHVLNPQSCRNLMEAMILDNHIIVRKMHQTTSTEPPFILCGILGNQPKKSKMVCQEHFVANPRSTYLL